MTFREAEIKDIEQIQLVRNSVTENTLSNPALVSDEDCREFISVRGKGWVGEMNGEIVGFSIADLKSNNIWALFVKPEFEKKGIGRQLHDRMLDWYFVQTNTTVWLCTSPKTRAEEFYKKAGWTEVGLHETNEIKFEMTFNEWAIRQKHSISSL